MAKRAWLTGSQKSFVMLQVNFWPMLWRIVRQEEHQQVACLESQAGLVVSPVRAVSSQDTFASCLLLIRKWKLAKCHAVRLSLYCVLSNYCTDSSSMLAAEGFQRGLDLQKCLRSTPSSKSLSEALTVR